MNRPLKRSLAACLIAVTLFTAAFSAFAFYFVKEAYRQEINTVINIAGAVLPENSNAEQPFLAAAKGETDTFETGSTILGKYGYNEHMRLLENSGYKKTVIILFAVTWGLWAVLTLFILVFFISIKRRQSRQEKSIAQVLEGYFSDDFSFLKDAEKQRLLLNQQFADTLFKLGRNLEHKSLLLAEEKNNTKSLVTDISHQLKTPLASLQLFVELDQGAHLEQEQVQLERMQALISGLLRLERLCADGYAFHFESHDLLELVGSCWQPLAKLYPEKTLTLTGTAALRCDEIWMGEAITNLLKNACEHTLPSGHIRISIEETAGEVAICLSDDGGGVSAEELPRLFERFYHGSHPGHGAGIGLAIVKEVVLRHHGSIAAENIPGGLQFTLFFPKLDSCLAKS